MAHPAAQTGNDPLKPTTAGRFAPARSSLPPTPSHIQGSSSARAARNLPKPARLLRHPLAAAGTVAALGVGVVVGLGVLAVTGGPLSRGKAPGVAGRCARRPVDSGSTPPPRARSGRVSTPPCLPAVQPGHLGRHAAPVPLACFPRGSWLRHQVAEDRSTGCTRQLGPGYPCTLPITACLWSPTIG
jgi:hypothetical protein